MQLRPYQSDAVDAVWSFIREHDGANPAVVLPTGSGKTHVIAELCREAVETWGGRVLVVAHVKELVEQAADKLRAVAPGLPVGVFSAGLGRRDLGYSVTIAGIQSVYQRAHDLGPIDLVIVDEAHLIPPDGEGMYRRLLADISQVTPHRRVVGLTATPYRMKTGDICGPENILSEVCFEAGVRELIAAGYLCPLKSRAGAAVADTSDLHVRGGEFVQGEVEDLMGEAGLVEAACTDIVKQTEHRRSVLIFAAGVAHGTQIVEMLESRHGVECGFVTGDTPTDERDELIARFKAGRLKFLANVNVLTTGFDAPNVDCVAMLRPTLSPGLYYQMVGRGFRLHEGKSECLVLDFGGNVLRHGPVDDIRLAATDGPPGEAPAKQCPGCDALIATGYAECPECGHQFPPRESAKHGAVASEAEVLSGGEGGPARNAERVLETAYYVHFKHGDPAARPTMRVEYRVGYSRWHREWICIEHEGYARRKAEHWWRARSHEEVPSTVEEAVELARAGALAEPSSIVIEKKPGDDWERVVGYDLGEKPPRLDDPDAAPEYAPAGLNTYGIPDDEIPF